MALMFRLAFVFTATPILLVNVYVSRIHVGLNSKQAQLPRRRPRVVAARACPNGVVGSRLLIDVHAAREHMETFSTQK